MAEETRYDVYLKGGHSLAIISADDLVALVSKGQDLSNENCFVPADGIVTIKVAQGMRAEEPDIRM